MEITPIRNLSDVESILQHNLSQLNIMSGDTSSPADGGHLRRGLPPSAALRWNHYHFVSPVHQKKVTSHKSQVTSRGTLQCAPTLLVGWMLLLFSLLVSSAHAEFTYQNPARTGLEEMETRPTGAQQLAGSRFQRQEAVSKLEAITLEKELSKIRKELDKTSKEIQQFRQKAQQFLETEKLRASGRTQQARAESELGFEYFRHENGMLELYQDGLTGAVLNEPVDETDEDGNVVGRGTRDTVDIEYFKGGAYHRMRKHFKVISRSGSTGEVQVLDREILEYVSGSKWYGGDDPKLTNNFQMVQKYKDISWSSQNSYKKEIRIVSGVQHDGDRRPLEWLEVRGSTDSAVFTTSLVKGASYAPNRGELNHYQSVAWNTQFPDISTVLEWSGIYKNGHLVEETNHRLDLSDGTSAAPNAMLEQMFQELEKSLNVIRTEVTNNLFKMTGEFQPLVKNANEKAKAKDKDKEEKVVEDKREDSALDRKSSMTQEEIDHLLDDLRRIGLLVGAVSQEPGFLNGISNIQNTVNK